MQIGDNLHKKSSPVFSLKKKKRRKKERKKYYDIILLYLYSAELAKGVLTLKDV